MVQQINLKIPDAFYEEAEIYAKSHGYMSIQELTREALRDKLYKIDEISDEEQLELEKLHGKNPKKTKINLDECVRL
jgi:hypothetical protein